MIITSDKSYKNIETNKGYKENDLLGGKDPYSASKASAELVIQSYLNHLFLKSNKNLIAVARAGNVIGGGDWSTNRLLTDCIKAWSKKKKVIIRNPNATRPWQHIFEALRGYLELAIRLSKNSNLHGEAFNFGPKNSQNKSVIELIKQAKKNWKNVNYKIVKSKKKQYESKLLKLNSNKAKRLLKWESKLNFSHTIKMVIDWYKYFYKSNKDLNKFSENQLKNYLRLL